MREKIKKHYQEKYASSPINISDEKIDILINHNCECDSCSDSIFKMDDFPEVLTDQDNPEVLCEYCYDEHYRKTCPICEESYDIRKGESDYQVINEEDANEDSIIPGIWHKGNCSSIKLVAAIRINYLENIKYSHNCCEVWSDDICPECVEKYVRKQSIIKTQSKPIILFKEYENNEWLKEYTKEQLHAMRRNVIHRRITVRGLIERGNNSKYHKKDMFL